MDPEDRNCKIAGCKETVTGRKPYCIDHLDRLPYVQHLLKTEEIRDKENQVAKKRNGASKINADSSRSKEILIQLAVKGTQTPKRLAIIIETEPAVLDAYIQALENKGYAKLLTVGSRRGSTRKIVTITDKGRRSVRSEII